MRCERWHARPQSTRAGRGLSGCQTRRKVISLLLILFFGRANQEAQPCFKDTNVPCAADKQNQVILSLFSNTFFFYSFIDLYIYDFLTVREKHGCGMSERHRGKATYGLAPV